MAITINQKPLLWFPLTSLNSFIIKFLTLFLLFWAFYTRRKLSRGRSPWKIQVLNSLAQPWELHQTVHFKGVKLKPFSLLFGLFSYFFRIKMVKKENFYQFLLILTQKLYESVPLWNIRLGNIAKTAKKSRKNPFRGRKIINFANF